jgi:ribosomal protein S18 acetylase RimI-like enzyme
MLEARPTFRFATATDVAAIVALVESAYRGDVSRKGWTTEADLLGGQRTDEGELQQILLDPKSRLLLAECDGVLVGSVLLRREENWGYIGMFAVHPTAQRNGLGKQLLSLAEQELCDRFNASIVKMTVLRQRADIITWYERRGYAKTGEVEPFPYGNSRFGTPKRDDLEFVVMVKTLTEK